MTVPPIYPLRLRDGAGTWFTGRDPSQPRRAVGDLSNLAHRRPHRPADLASARRSVGEAVGYAPSRWHLMRQVHGARVGVIGSTTPVGAQLQEVDALVTTEVDRPLVVQVADCVPVLLAGRESVAVAHAGRRGLVEGVVPATISSLIELGEDAHTVVAGIGPAIGGCCYEVPETLRAEVGASHPAAIATTSWGTPSLDVRAGVRAQLEAAGIREIHELDACTHCDDRWFSHRRDPTSGRQVGIAVRGSAQREGAL